MSLGPKTKEAMEKQKNLETALQVAIDELHGKDRERLAQDAGLAALDDGKFEIAFMGRRLVLDIDEATFLDEDGTEPKLRQKIILLHYVCAADGTAWTGKDVAFAEIPGASFYDGVFAGRIRGRTAGTFGKVLDAFEQAAAAMGGTKGSFGDVSMTIPVLPRVPITIVIWRGDEEFEAQSNLLFDASISSYLSVEDIVVLCEELVGELTKAVYS